MTDRPNEVLWTPSERQVAATRMASFAAHLNRRHGLDLDPADYASLHRHSVENLDQFWRAIAEFFSVDLGDPAPGPGEALSSEAMHGARWFPGRTVSYPEHAFRDRDPDAVAVIDAVEEGQLRERTWAELRSLTARLSRTLAEAGVGEGDRVAAYLPNCAEALAAFLATASLGAVWSSCSPDFGPGAAIDRLGQLEPKVLLAADGYRYGGRAFDRTDVVRAMAAEMPTLRRLILLDRIGAAAGMPATSVPTISWEEAAAGPDPELEFRRVPFEHPLWVLFSSGTTGMPKGLVHSQGGILLEHLKWIGLQVDAGPGDRLFWMTTTGWTMWNFVIGGLLTGSAVVLYDGSPAQPDLGALWDLAERSGVSIFGAGAGFFTSCRKAGVEPRGGRALAALRAVGSTGSPLMAEDFDWIYDRLGDVWLFSTSGGTDVCTAFVGGTPTLPVRRGELQAPALGVDVAAWDEEDRPLRGEVGELVVTRPMPSMPVHLLDDPDGERYRDAYFDVYDGVWRHGDWIEMTASGGAVIHGRSDSTINRGGVRIGSAELYRAVLTLERVADALVVEVGGRGGPGAGDATASQVWLFLVTAGERPLDDKLVAAARDTLRSQCSPRHVPDRILEAPELPRTLSGKLIETPIRRIFAGAAPEEVVSRDALANPEALDWFARLAQRVAADYAEPAATAGAEREERA